MATEASDGNTDQEQQRQWLSAFLHSLRTTRELKAMLRWKASTVVRAFQWADTIAHLRNHSNNKEEALLALLHTLDAPSSRIDGVYEAMEEVVRTPHAVLFRAILTSEYLHLSSEHSFDVFAETIRQYSHRLGDADTSNILQHSVAFNVEQRKQREQLYGSGSQADLHCCALALMKKLLHSSTMKKECVNGLIARVLSTAQDDYVTFLIVCQATILSPTELLPIVPLIDVDASLKQLFELQEILLDKVVYLLAVTDTLRIVDPILQDMPSSSTQTPFPLLKDIREKLLCSRDRCLGLASAVERVLSSEMSDILGQYFLKSFSRL